MKRRKFLATTVAATSACTLAASTMGSTLTINQEKKKSIRCKITVLRKDYHQDLYEKYTNGKGKICQAFQVGGEYITKNKWDCPENFCNWAWADIRPFIQQISMGRESAVVCCTDGFRPVYFLLER
ncbi:MAG: TIGR04076 family protein, partial [Prolixibacteraceae bacterium]|nr:TIGR04076 family protein [Prolixibacteraceae bacterium]